MSYRSRRACVAAAGAALVGSVLHQPHSFGVTRYYTTDTTVDTDIGGQATIGYASEFNAFNKIGPSSPTVTVVVGGRFKERAGGAVASVVYNDSILNISGGSVDDVTAVDTATVNVNSGFFAGLVASGTSTINIFGGETDPALAGSLRGDKEGTLNLFAGTIRGGLLGASTTTVNGIEIVHTPFFNLQGGSISGKATVSSEGKMTLAGTTVGSLEARQFAQITMTAGAINGNVDLFNNATFKMTDGSIGGNLAANNSVVVSELSSASITGSVSLVGSANVTVSGSTIGGSFSARGNNLTMSGSAVGGSLSIFATADITSSTIGGLTGRGVVTMSGGEIVNNVTTDSGWAADFDLTVGSVGGNVTSQSEGQIDLTGAATGGSVTVRNTSRTSIHGGSVAGNVTLFDTGTFGLDGGASVAGDVSAGGSNTITINGGSVTGGLFAGAASNVQVSGSQLGSIGFFSAVGGQLNVGTTAVFGDVNTDSGTSSFSETLIEGKADVSGTAVMSASGGRINGLTARGSSAVTLNNTLVGPNPSGGSASPTADLSVLPSASVTLNGATVTGTANVTGGTLTFGAGSIEGDVVGSGSGQVTMTGGFVGGDVLGQGTATVNLSGGNVAGNVQAQEGSVVNLDGTTVTKDVLATAGTVTMVSQVVSGRLLAWGTGTIDMTGGTVEEALGAGDSGQVTMSGGTAATAGATGNAAMTLSGGTVTGEAFAYGASTVALDGAAVSGKLFVDADGTFDMSGGSAAVGVDVAGRGMFNFTGGTLSGDVTVREDGQADLAGDVGGDVIVEDDAEAVVRAAGIVNGSARLMGPGRLNIDGTVRSSLIVQNEGSKHGFVAVAGTVEGNVIAAELTHIFVNAGGTIGGLVECADFVSFDVRGGVVNGDAFFHGSSSVGDGGQIRGSVDTFALLQVHDGTIGGNVRVFDGTLIPSTFHLGSITDGEYSGTFPGIVGGDVTVFQQSKVEFSIGEISGDLAAWDRSDIEMTGGTVGGNLSAFENSTIDIRGGIVWGVGEAYGRAKINYIGGAILGGLEQPSAESWLREALATTSTHFNLIAHDDATINIYGTDLQAILVDPDYDGGMFSLYQLTGTLADGTSAGQYFAIQNGTGASYQLLPPEAIPEPAGLALCAAAAIVTRRRRNRPPSKRA